jgi:hypothetical protein
MTLAGGVTTSVMTVAYGTRRKTIKCCIRSLTSYKAGCGSGKSANSNAHDRRACCDGDRGSKRRDRRRNSNTHPDPNGYSNRDFSH